LGRGGRDERGGKEKGRGQDERGRMGMGEEGRGWKERVYLVGQKCTKIQI